MLKGVKFDMPVIDCHRGYTEGRHRVLAAKKIGVKQIPVFMVEKVEGRKQSAHAMVREVIGGNKDRLVSPRPELLRVGTVLVRKSDLKTFYIIDIKKIREFGKEVMEYTLASPTALGFGGELKTDFRWLQAYYDVLVESPTSMVQEAVAPEMPKEDWEITRAEYGSYFSGVALSGYDIQFLKKLGLKDSDLFRANTGAIYSRITGLQEIYDRLQEVEYYYYTKVIPLWLQPVIREYKTSIETDLDTLRKIIAKVRILLPHLYGIDRVYIGMEVHKKEVEKALREGKPIPQAVLRDYPDLMMQAEKQRWRRKL